MSPSLPGEGPCEPPTSGLRVAQNGQRRSIARWFGGTGTTPISSSFAPPAPRSWPLPPRLLPRRAGTFPHCVGNIARGTFPNCVRNMNQNRRWVVGGATTDRRWWSGPCVPNHRLGTSPRPLPYVTSWVPIGFPGFWNGCPGYPIYIGTNTHKTWLLWTSLGTGLGKPLRHLPGSCNAASPLVTPHEGFT